MHRQKEDNWHKIIDSRLRKLEDRFGTGDGKPRILFVVCRAGYQHEIDRHVDILDESGFLPTDPIGLNCLAGVPRTSTRRRRRCIYGKTAQIFKASTD